MNDDRRCAAMSKRSGERCKRAAIRGGRVCATHGGSSRQAKAAAARRLAESKAAESLAAMGVTPLGDPLEAFRELAAEALALKDFFAATVAELRGQLTNVDRQGREDVKAKVAAYERAMDRAGRLLGEYVRLGIEDRLAALDERRAVVVERVIVAVLAAVGVALDDRVRGIVHRELTAAAGASKVVDVR